MRHHLLKVLRKYPYGEFFSFKKERPVQNEAHESERKWGYWLPYRALLGRHRRGLGGNACPKGFLCLRSCLETAGHRSNDDQPRKENLWIKDLHELHPCLPSLLRT